MALSGRWDQFWTSASARVFLFPTPSFGGMRDSPVFGAAVFSAPLRLLMGHLTLVRSTSPERIARPFAHLHILRTDELL